MINNKNCETIRNSRKFSKVKPERVLERHSYSIIRDHRSCHGPFMVHESLLKTKLIKCLLILLITISTYEPRVLLRLTSVCRDGALQSYLSFRDVKS